MKEFKMSVEGDGEIARILMSGEFTSISDADMEDTVNRLLDEEGYRLFEFDFGSVTYIDSAAFGILIALVDSIRKKEGRATFRDMDERFRRMAGLIGLGSFVEFAGSGDPGD